MDSHYLGENWYSNLKLEMAELDLLAKIVYGATMSYFKSQKAEGKNQAAAASNLFWQLSERKFQDLVNACGQGEEQTNVLRKDFAQFVSAAYNAYCPNNTARQLNAWAREFTELKQISEK